MSERGKAQQGLPKSRRLSHRAEYAAVIEQGRRARDALFAVYSMPNRLPHARLGVIVGRRVSGKATVRNRIKRHIRESFRQHQQELTGLDVVVAAQPPAARAEPSQLRVALARHWERLIEKPRADTP